jgi:ATP-dependent DNA helicase RecQ
MMVMGKDDLYNFQIKFPKYEPLIKVLLRSYGGLYEQYAYIKEKDVAYRAKISEHELSVQLENLQKQGVISFIPQTDLPKLIFLQNRINLKFESIRLINYPVLKEKALTRINSVVNYVKEKNICRSRLLLSYFNETDFKDCQYCDVCIEKYKRNMETDEGLVENIKLELASQTLNLRDLMLKFQSINAKRLNQVINEMIDNNILVTDAEKNITLK